MADEEGFKRQESLVPIPDPTLLTTAQLYREISNIAEILGGRIDATDRTLAAQRDDLSRRISDVLVLLETKIAGLDHASIGRYEQLRAISEERVANIHSLFNERELRTKAISDHISVAREEAVKNAKEASETRNLLLAHDEKFNSVDIRFRDFKIAFDAALMASKEAADRQNAANTTASYKTEAAFTKQIDQLNTLSQQSARAADEKINDLKDRILAMEGVRKGGSDVIGWIVGLAGIIIAGITLTVTIIRHL